MSYLKNDICKFKLINKTKLRKSKINILSSCFFKMDKHYKNFNIYVNGLKRWIKFLDSFDHNYIFRLFIDSNIKKDKYIMKLINSTDKIEPVLFECKDYKKNNYHIDLFATLVRFFPYFNFKNNDSKNVIVVDVDLHLDDLRKCKLLMKKNFKGFVGAAETGGYFYKGSKLYVIANLMSYGKKCDSRIITKFIKNAHKIVDKGHYNKRRTTWGFGVDEIFINKFLLKHVEHYSSIFEYYVTYFLYYSKKQIMKSKRSKKIFKVILGKYHHDDMDVTDMYNFIDKKIYQVRKVNPLVNYISKRFYKVIRYLYEKDLKWMDRKIIRLINNHFNNVIYAFAIVTTSYSNIDSCKIKLIKPIYVK